MKLSPKVGTIITDCLTNCCSECVHGSYGESEKPATMYARGIVNGMVSILVAQGFEFPEAIAEIVKYAPTDTVHGSFDWEAIPPSFREEFAKHWPESYAMFQK